MKQITIYDLLPLLKPGWVAMDGEGTWVWYRLKPDLSTFYAQWLPARVGSGESMELWGFDIAPFEGDWKDSLMEKKNDNTFI